MGFPIDIKEFENCINKDNFNKTVFDSQIFYLVKCNFTLLAALEDFVSDCEKNDSDFIIGNRKLWLVFLQIYYYRLNYSRNILKTILREGIITQQDIDFTSESLYWTLESIQSLFKDDCKKPLHFGKVIFSGRWYSSLHYYIGSIESFCIKSLGQQCSQTFNNLQIIEDERQWIDSLYADLYKRKLAGEDIQLSDEIHERITNMWYRTIDFIQDELIPEFQGILLNQAK